jgi:hypothetical protein
MKFANIGTTFIVEVIIKLVIIILFGLTYVYVDNLEKKGCKCAILPESKFIKTFSLFAVIFLVIVMFIPNNIIYSTVGPTLAILIKSIEIIFSFVCIYWFYVTYNYTRYLVNEKCKCSDDIRRDIIMSGSLIELIIIFFIFMLGLLIAIISVTIATTINYMINNDNNLYETVINPARSILKIPSKVKSSIGDIKNLGKNTFTNLKKVISSKK